MERKKRKKMDYQQKEVKIEGAVAKEMLMGSLEEKKDEEMKWIKKKKK